MERQLFKNLLILAVVFIAGCKKDGDSTDGTNYILKENFESVYLLRERDWKFVNNNAPGITAQWTQGNSDPKGYPPGFPATDPNAPDDYAFVNGFYPYVTGPADISSWMITPSLLLKNGDIIRFYTRSTNQPGNINRLQLLLNETNDSYDAGSTPASAGAFTKTLLDINANQTADAFPTEWALQSVTIAGLNGTSKTRLAFRYLVNGLTASGVGVDDVRITRY